MSNPVLASENNLAEKRVGTALPVNRFQSATATANTPSHMDKTVLSLWPYGFYEIPPKSTSLSFVIFWAVSSNSPSFHEAWSEDQEMAAYDALWDKSFAESEDFLDAIADEIHAKYLAGLTEDFDPDTDPDLR
jgi:hypothetical protein